MNSSIGLRSIASVTAPDQELQINTWVSTFAPGLTELGEQPHAMVCMHLGASVEVRCMRGGTVRQGREVAGDLDIVPARTASSWEMKQEGATLVMCVPDALLRAVALRLDRDPGAIDIADCRSRGDGSSRPTVCGRRAGAPGSAWPPPPSG